MIYSCVTDRGKKRPVNEDSCYVCTKDDNSCVAVVCDGMGGENAGEIASGIAVKVISGQINSRWRKDMTDSSVTDLFSTAIHCATVLIYDKALSQSELEGMGTTVVAAAVIGNSVTVAHVGDSRCYVFDGHLRAITRDHSLVRELIDSGKLTEEEAKSHPGRNYLTRALGVSDYTEVEFDYLTLEPGNLLLLCTDGLFNFVDNEEAEEILRNSSVRDAAQKLTDAANNNGGGDNITAVVISPAQGE